MELCNLITQRLVVNKNKIAAINHPSLGQITQKTRQRECCIIIIIAHFSSLHAVTAELPELKNIFVCFRANMNFKIMRADAFAASGHQRQCSVSSFGLAGKTGSSSFFPRWRRPQMTAMLHRRQRKSTSGSPKLCFWCVKPGVSQWKRILNNATQLNTHVLHVAVFGPDVILSPS